jgi:RsiW-degrading membrane proteinase PrsW (M82 family)
MTLSSLLFLVAAALIPPFVILGVVYRMDKIEREPARLLWSLFFWGALAMVPILVLELLADQFIEFFPWRPIVYLFLSYFVVPGFIEEGVKYRVFLKKAWNDPNFDYRFDGVVYAVFISLGFAAVENVMYVLTSGFSTAVVRAIFSIPGHAMFGVVMGAGCSQAKWMEAHRQFQQAAALRTKSWVTAAILHGLYDFLLMGFGGVFYVYFVLLVIYVVKLLRKSAREDGPIM